MNQQASAAAQLPVVGARRPRGFILWFTGISDPYEPPEAPEVTVRTDSETVEQSVERILSALRQRGISP